MELPSPQGAAAGMDSSPISIQPDLEQQTASPSRHPTSSEESSPPHQDSPAEIPEQKSSKQQLSDSEDAFAPGNATPPSPRGPSPPTRPQHSGWEPTTINMAKCDYCDQRRRGTLYRCAQCQIAICKACASRGVLDHDSKHKLDHDSVDWNLHPAAAVKPENKRLRKPASGAKSTPTTRARARARRGRSKRTAASRNIDDEGTADEDMTDAPVDQANEDEQAGAVLAGLAQPRSTLANRDGEQAASGPDANEPVTAYYQSELQAPKPQRHLTQQLSMLNPSPTPQAPGLSRSVPPRVRPPGFRAIRPRPAQPQFDPYHTQQTHLDPRQPPFVPGQNPHPAYPAPQEMGHRANPYVSQGWNAPTSTNHEEANRLHAIDHSRPSADFLQRQEKNVTESNIDPRLIGASSQPRHQQPLTGVGVELPPLRNYEQGPPQSQQYQEPQQPQYYPDPSILQQKPLSAGKHFEQVFAQRHLQNLAQLDMQHREQLPEMHREQLPKQIPVQNPIQNPEQQPVQNSAQQAGQQTERQTQRQAEQAPIDEELIQRIGIQLEADALVTHEENTNLPMDECLRTEVMRVWNRRNTRASLLHEALHANPNVAEDTQNAFHTLLSAQYYASIRLQLNVQNASRTWISETLKQLINDGLAEPIQLRWPFA